MSQEERKETSNQDEVLERTLELLAPVVRLLMTHGIDHPRFSAALKRVYVDEAQADLQRRGQKATHTALSLLAGLQRRDVKALLSARGAELPRKARSPTLPIQAMVRWASEPRFLDPEGNPRPLPMRSSDPDQPTFEHLADGVSKDVHPPALLDEMVRLGLARVEAGEAQLLSMTPVATSDLKKMLGPFSRNAHDHLAAAVTNLIEGRQRFLEYSVYADELRPESAEELQAMARKLWANAYKRTVVMATDLIERDKPLGFTPEAPETRMRVGMYFYAEPKEPVPPRTDEDDGASDEAAED